MNYIVRRKHDEEMFGYPGWLTNTGHDAERWIGQNLPGTLVENSYNEYIFNNKDAAMRFKLVWG